MDERETLKRQIELLQNLINNHKSLHGDAPTGQVQQRSAETSTLTRGHGSATMRLDAPHSCASWRKTYSLKNKNPQPSAAPASAVSSCGCTAASGAAAARGRGTAHPARKDDGARVNSWKRSAVALSKAKTDGAVTEAAREKAAASSQRRLLLRGPRECDLEVEGKQKVVSPDAAPSISSRLPQVKPSCVRETIVETKREAATPSTSAGVAAPPPRPSSSSSCAALVKPSKQPAGKQRHHAAAAAFPRTSQFRWVKRRQGAGGAEEKPPSPVGAAAAAAATTSSAAAAAAGVTRAVTPGRKGPGRKSLRRRSPAVAAHKTSKYKWVSSSARLSRKWASPKPATPPPERAELLRRAKCRKDAATSRAPPSVSSRYCWQAAGQSGQQGAATCRRSTVWLRGGHAAASSSSLLRSSHQISCSPSCSSCSSSSSSSSPSSSSSSSPGAFKLRSKMKIIRRSASSAGGGGGDRGCSSSAPKLPQRSRAHCSLLRRSTPSRELVSFGRHKLRRLSTTHAKTRASASCSSSCSSSASHHTDLGSRHRSQLTLAHFYNPALTWRAKRIQSARCFLQSRQSLRTHHYKTPAPPQRWRGSSMCWIRGSLYRVSANKLSRTVGSSMSINRTGRSSSSSGGGGHSWSSSLSLSRHSATRHLACRAIQRSLAIIRQAQQKKQPKQYCMYYNRFGKCKRGTSCPYIHDPDKVAVCTRFLRGTCKQADGSCPFSHKVAKEKMPVCSYFLKGICSNSDCPYSHVYVSRKAKVCDDFVKGYCPEGEKCKKKHTLVCPDFLKAGSCPRRAHCKLQHHRGPKRGGGGGANGGTSCSTPAKRARTKEACRGSEQPVVIRKPADTSAMGQCLASSCRTQASPETPATRGPLELPSFISLCSSPEEAEPLDAPPGHCSRVKEKKLQIKPRL